MPSPAQMTAQKFASNLPGMDAGGLEMLMGYKFKANEIINSIGIEPSELKELIDQGYFRRIGNSYQLGPKLTTALSREQAARTIPGFWRRVATSPSLDKLASQGRIPGMAAGTGLNQASGMGWGTANETRFGVAPRGGVAANAPSLENLTETAGGYNPGVGWEEALSQTSKPLSRVGKATAGLKGWLGRSSFWSPGKGVIGKVGGAFGILGALITLNESKGSIVDALGAAEDGTPLSRMRDKMLDRAGENLQLQETNRLEGELSKEETLGRLSGSILGAERGMAFDDAYGGMKRESELSRLVGGDLSRASQLAVRSQPTVSEMVLGMSGGMR